MSDIPIPHNCIRVVIRNKEKILFQGDVKAVTSNNDAGKFDVLAMHSNFISLIKDYVLIHKVDGTTEELKLENGLMRVLTDQVEIFIGISHVTSIKPAPGAQPQTKPASSG